MKKQYIIIGYIICQLLIGCKQNHFEKKDKSILLNYYRNYSDSVCIWKTDSILISKSIENDTLRFIYKQDIDTLGISFCKSVDNDSSIYMYGKNCPLVLKKTYKINNRDFTIEKYYYDDENSEDEESSFYYNKDYGLLVEFNDGWMDLILSIEYDGNSKILIDSIINDWSGFYSGNFLIPPPPPDSLE